jgi:Protein of unknown function (DUF2380)
MPRTLFGIRTLLAAALLGATALSHAGSPCPEPVATSSPIDIAIFDFELDDATPASALLDKSTSSATSLDRATLAARREFAQSGRYRVIEGSLAAAKAAQERTLRNCEGCEAEIASQLGAQQSLVGVIRRATQTDYYVQIQIRDACSGKILDAQDANFAGSEEGWASGVRMLIRHQVLPNDETLANDAEPSSSNACKVAAVNPVTGFAECVEPRGAPVAPPPAGMRP